MTTQTKINRSDLKIYPSERLTDNDDGGGMPIGTPLTGAKNELFNPISSIARVNGGFYTRSVFAGVLRADDEPLIGSFTAITKPAKDPTVKYVLFPATRFGESRAEIIKRIESYSVATIESKMTLLSTQTANSKIVQAYQRVGEALPLIGDVYCLRQDKSGYPKAEQYIQVTKVTSEDRTFTNPETQKEFVRTVIKMEISQSLEADFIGAGYPSEYYIDNPCKVRETNVADAGQYYGVKPLDKAITANQMTLKIGSLMEQIVPTNQVETQLLDLSASGKRNTLFDGSKQGDAGIVTININKQHNVGMISNIYVGNAITPSSVVMTTGSGEITDTGGTLYQGENAVGSVDYANGFLLVNAADFSGYLNHVKFRPSANDIKVADTASTPVTINNRSSNYSINIEPAPAVGTLQVSYRSQGKWYTLTDNGAGVLKGATDQHGSGNVNFITGTANISLTELPDVGSRIVWSWGTRANYFNRGGRIITNTAIDTSLGGAILSSIVLSVTDDSGVVQTAKSDRFGNITGAFTGKTDGYNLTISRINVALSGKPEISVKYRQARVDFIYNEYTVRGESGDGDRIIIVSMWHMEPGTLRIEWSASSGAYAYAKGRFVYYDDGNGNLIDDSGAVVGTVDYAAKKARFDSGAVREVQKMKFNKHGDFVGYEIANEFTTFSGAIVSVVSAAVDATKEISLSGMQIDLLPQFNEVIVPSSLSFMIRGKRYFDNSGRIYTDLDPLTGGANVVGTINYATGNIVFDSFNLAMLGDVEMTSLATTIRDNPVQKVTFRTPTSPIRPSSIAIRATTLDGSQLTLTADNSGNIQGDATGTVDYEYGVVDVTFGRMVTAAGNERKSWYDADKVKDGKIWQPLYVFADSIVYNATGYSYLPVANSIIKIDTVRLPQDGRVPIFRRGDTILITNTQEQNLGSAFTGGQTVKLDRDNLDRICLQDSDGKAVLATLWDYDLVAGSITFNTALDLSNYKLPLIAKHTHEERNRVIEADIDGTLSLQFATKRDYPLDNTYVSSILIGGDLQVRMSVPFTQRNWDNVWRDEPKGEQLLNKLNVKDYPAVLTDDGAITDRWLIKFVSGSNFELYSEALGFVLKTDTLQDLAPINPATGKPYFTIPKQAFGNDAPWATQDVIRFNTWGTLLPVWVLCAVQPTANPLNEDDGFTVCVFGDTTEVE